jgi:hypothetical protein
LFFNLVVFIPVDSAHFRQAQQSSFSCGQSRAHHRAVQAPAICGGFSFPFLASFQYFSSFCHLDFKSEEDCQEFSRHSPLFASFSTFA